MTDSFIQLPGDSSGKQLDTALVNMGVGTTAVHREKVVIADPLSTSALATVTSSGGLQVFSTLARTIAGAVTTSGLSFYHSMATGGAVATNITTAPSAFYGYALFNSLATSQFVKFYNTTGPIVGGSTANLVLTLMAPGNGGANMIFPIGIYSSGGWSHVISAGMNDTDTGAPVLNAVSLGVFYQT